MKKEVIWILGLISLLTACNKKSITTIHQKTIDPIATSLGIEKVPVSANKRYRKYFDHYTKVLAPNGKPIKIFAQDQITNEQIIRVRNVLKHYLTDLPGSQYGADKSAIANKMAENKAVLLLLNGRDDGKNPAANLRGQPLFEEEIQVEGHPWYVNQEYRGHRDATYEEILHLVHDTGIGVDGRNSMSGAAPDFQKEIRAAQKNALQNKLWGMGTRAQPWIQELSQENSLSQEYLAALIDAYYGLWGAWKQDQLHSMWGIYVAKDRKAIAKKDALGQNILNNKFFHPYLTYNARIDAGFQGTFSLKFDAAIPYTHHSQYLKDITLLGKNNTKVRVNELDNDITGNAGINTVIFSGISKDYVIKNVNGITKIIDKVLDRDGVNTLKKVEKIKFKNKEIDL
ncbi:hypothetical protein BKI52_16205 [marine bacterium AO1-C]|nr:hypothetical protein BKI52_16205 [marine bacterium AO1-C]